MADPEQGGVTDNLEKSKGDVLHPDVSKTETDGLLDKDEDDSFELNWGSCSTEEYKDWPYAVLFILNIAFLITLLIGNYEESFFSTHTSHSKVYCNSDGVCATSVVSDSSYYTIFVALGAGIVLSLVWMVLLQCMPTVMVQAGMAFAVALPGFMAVVALFSSHWVAFAILLVFTFIGLYWWYIMQTRITLAAKMLEMSAKFITGHTDLIGIAVASLLFSIVFMLLWASSFYCTMMSMGVIQEDGARSPSKHTGVGVMTYFFLTFYWAINVFSNTLHVVTAGAFAEYWIMGDDDANHSKVHSSLKRALTSSFGSICFGSLLVSVFQALRAIVRYGEQGDDEGCSPQGFVRSCASCMFSCIAEIMDFINTYAFVHVAVYGDDFCTAGSKTWGLIRSSGFDMVINQDLTAMTLLFAAMGGAVLGGGATYILAKETTHVHQHTAMALALIGAVITFGCMTLIMSLTTSCVAAIYVLYVEKPTEGMLQHPDDVTGIVEAWRDAYGDMNWIRRGDAYIIEPPPEYEAVEDPADAA